MEKQPKFGGLTLAALAAVLGALLAAGACRDDRDWPPDLAALADGQPIELAALNRELAWGLRDQLIPEKKAASGSQEAETALRRRLLWKMIDERLTLAEAARRRIGADPEEVDRAIGVLDADWFGRTPRERLESLRPVLRERLILHKMTEIIMTEGRELSAEAWEKFRRGWPQKRPVRYKAKVLLLPPTPEPPEIPARERGDLESLAERFKLEGFSTVVSEPLWLRSDHLDADRNAALETAWARRRPSEPLRLDSSWAIYQVLEVDRRTEAAAELRAARAAYELAAGEEAFRRWLLARRASADIKINPNLAGE